MSRYRITIEYDGTPFVGWQAQARGLSVQEAVETAILRFSGERVRIRAAGRTDSGVHALGQVAHLDLSRAWEPFKIREALNHHLRPHPVAVLDCREVPPGFDARFSAVRRHYLYRILARRARPALDRDRVWWVAVDIDAGRMREAASVLVGHHDFTTFRAAQCQAASPVKTLERFEVTTAGEEIRCEVSARSFLHNQVRSMVGSLKQVGTGRWSLRDLQDAMQARDRRACGPVAPACGLYLAAVDYPADLTAAPADASGAPGAEEDDGGD